MALGVDRRKGAWATEKMLKVASCQVPAGSLLHACIKQGAYADCYFVDIERRVTHAQFVSAFYTTKVFWLERVLLKLLLSRPSTNREAEKLAEGTTDSFAIWRVEKRERDQLLLADYTGRTKSWLMVEVSEDSAEQSTRLFFGSAVMPKSSADSRGRKMGSIFYALLWIHKLYSQVLLASAKAKLSN